MNERGNHTKWSNLPGNARERIVVHAQIYGIILAAVVAGQALAMFMVPWMWPMNVLGMAMGIVVAALSLAYEYRKAMHDRD